MVDGKIIKKIVLGDHYKWLTVGEVLDKVESIAKGLYDMGIRSNDRVVIYAEASPNWFFCSLALAKLGATLVTLYSNLGNSGVMYGINQTKSQYVITTEELKNKLLTFSDKMPNLKNIIYMKSVSSSAKDDGLQSTNDSIKIRSLDETESIGSKMVDHKFQYPKPDDIALIMYTSGTTSLPKAVMITHKQLLANMKSMTVLAEDNNFDLENSTLGSFLPLAHIFGYVFNIYMFISK